GGCSTGNLQPTLCPVEYYGDKGSVAARKACSLIGKPYIWGASGPGGYDCSGLTLTAWASVGVTLGHYTGWQWGETRSGTRAQLHPGDLVFFYIVTQHVCIYSGRGSAAPASAAGWRGPVSGAVRMASRAGARYLRGSTSFGSPSNAARTARVIATFSRVPTFTLVIPAATTDRSPASSRPDEPCSTSGT